MTATRDVTWDADERQAWTPFPRQSPSEWSEAHRLVRLTSRPGPWRNDRQPILKGLMDLCGRRQVNELWVQKCAQFGGSEAMRNVLGWVAHHRPCGVLYVMPNAEDGRKIVDKYLHPLLDGREVPALAAVQTGRARDVKLTNVKLLNGFDLQLAWAGSPASLASEPRQVVFLDEVDKFLHEGHEAHPVDLARERLTTFYETGRSLLVAVSTPTVADGPISRGFNACPIRLHYYVHCPFCGRAQRLVWDRVTWDAAYKDKKAFPEPTARAAMIRDRDAAGYECADPACGRLIREGSEPGGTDVKRDMLLGGYWGTADGAWRLWYDGREEGEMPPGDRVGVQFSRLYDLSYRWSSLAARWVETDGLPELVQAFRNGSLGEPNEESQYVTTVRSIARKSLPSIAWEVPEEGFVPPPARRVQPWASRLLMTVDTQQDHFYWVVRAWGHNYRSHRVDHGIARTFDDLEALSERNAYPYVGDAFAPLRVSLLGIDARGGTDDGQNDANRTDQVYQWCRASPTRRFPVVGHGQPMADPRYLQKKIAYQPRNHALPGYHVWVYVIDANYWRDILAGYKSATMPLADPQTGEVLQATADRWMLNDANDEVYNRHLSNLVKVSGVQGRKQQQRWVPKSAGARHDYSDCEHMNLMLAHGPGMCHNLPTESAIRQLHSKADTPRKAVPAKTAPGGRTYLANRRGT